MGVESCLRLDEIAWISVVSTFRKSRSLRNDRTSARARSSLARARSLCGDRALARARSLHSDRAGRALGRYVVTELWLELGRYRPSGTSNRLLRCDRTACMYGSYAMTEFGVVHSESFKDTSS
ncbi:hypothetical protein F2Q68_00010185 [Brassica cretica]|uniref:Uncharacterized protein n=1 Tax=Brassica cretica TaxID=69181 RepID=A0A8S9L0K7_BRACR|nr:hypothetical protein F2Q68_00010185 [Brassica cretica]